MESDSTIYLMPARAGLPDLSPPEVLGTALFHGTSARFSDDLRCSGYDGVLWTARTPAVAQTYIPLSGISTACDLRGLKRRGHERVTPLDPLYVEIALQMGWKLTRYEPRTPGTLGSWSWEGGPKGGEWPNLADIYEYLTSTLGYHDDEPFKKLLVRITDGRSEILPADVKTEGRLFVLLPKRPLRIFNLSGSRECDAMDPEYHRIADFRKAEEAGYDGIRITDLAQSPSGGNVPHTSIGLFERALSSLEVHVMSATHFDCALAPPLGTTPEFLAGVHELTRSAPFHSAPPRTHPRKTLARSR